MNSFDRLVEDIKDVLGPSSGIDSADVDVEDLTLLMERYTSNVDEWRKYAMSSPHMAYTRNLVDEGNGKANLVCRLVPQECSNSRVTLADHVLLPSTAHPRVDAWQG